MAVSKDTAGAYAPASAVLDIIDRYRNKGMPKPFTADVLARAGVSDSLIPRTMQALQVLDLIDEVGNPTQVMESLRLASEAEFKSQLAAWLTAAYADVLQFAAATDDETAIRDAFRAYNPVGQQSRMIALFLGLSRAAGMRGDDQVQTKSRPTARKAVVASSTPRKTGRVITGIGAMHAGNSAISTSGLPAPLAGLLTKLPPEHGSWTTKEREKFVATFSAVLDFCFTVDDQPAQGHEDDDADL